MVLRCGAAALQMHRSNDIDAGAPVPRVSLEWIDRG